MYNIIFILLTDVKIKPILKIIILGDHLSFIPLIVMKIEY